MLEDLEPVTLSSEDIRRHVGGRFFRVTFFKRTNGKIRTMVCRLGVGKFVTGEGPVYDFEHKGLLSVWDVQNRGYRTVPLDGILDLRCGEVTIGEQDGL